VVRKCIIKARSSATASHLSYDRFDRKSSSELSTVEESVFFLSTVPKTVHLSDSAHEFQRVSEKKTEPALHEATNKLPPVKSATSFQAMQASSSSRQRRRRADRNSHRHLSICQPRRAPTAPRRWLRWLRALSAFPRSSHLPRLAVPSSPDRRRARPAKAKLTRSTVHGRQIQKEDLRPRGHGLPQ